MSSGALLISRHQRYGQHKDLLRHPDNIFLNLTEVYFITMEQIASFRDLTEQEKNVNVFILFAVGTFFLWMPYLRFAGFFGNSATFALLLLRRYSYANTQKSYSIVAFLAYVISLILLAASVILPTVAMPSYLTQHAPLAVREMGFDHLVLAYLVILIAFSISLSISFLGTTWNLLNGRDRVIGVAAMALLVALPLFNVLDLSQAMITGYNIAIDFDRYNILISSIVSYAGRFWLYSAIPLLMFVYIFARTAKNVDGLSNEEQERLTEKILVRE